MYYPDVSGESDKELEAKNLVMSLHRTSPAADLVAWVLAPGVEHVYRSVCAIAWFHFGMENVIWYGMRQRCFDSGEESDSASAGLGATR